MTVTIHEVGGCVRDDLLGLHAKDVDFVVIAPSFDAMRQHITDWGLRIFLEKPEFVTIRAGVPKDHPLRARCKDADFVLARKDGPSTDGRRPDFVEPGTLLDDLSRRDFTVNAIAKDALTGTLIDPFNGARDLENKTLRFVGDPMERIREDGLRVMRGFRFMVTKGLTPSPETERALHSCLAGSMLAGVSRERVREELNKMLRHDTLETLTLLSRLDPAMRAAIFKDGLRLEGTMKR